MTPIEYQVVGEENTIATYSFWEGALEQDPPLNRLIRLLEVL